jgi:RimJ/RimL family protein N-acetyltransferase
MNKANIVLPTTRLLLRPFKEDDAESLYLYASNPNIGPRAGWAVHTSVKYSREIIRNVLSEEETYAIVLKGTDTPIGSAGIILCNKTKNSEAMGINDGEIGYWIGEPFWGQGLAPEAVNELLRHGFSDLELDTVWCGYYEGNQKSKRVQEKCGFTFHHTETDKPCPMLDETRTEHFTYISKKEWADLNSLHK